jgi:hypothetical protein
VLDRKEKIFRFIFIFAAAAAVSSLGLFVLLFLN